MHTRVDRSEGPSYARHPPQKKMVSINHKNVKKKHRHLRMYTRTGPYVVTYMMLIIMLIYVNDLI